MKKLLFPLLLAVASLGAAHAQNRSITLKSDGTVEDSHSSTIGYVRSDGTVEDSHRNTIGYFRSGAVEDSHHNTISHESSMSRNEVAVRYFFFK